MSETMLSPRRRRLRLTATLLAIVGVIGGISGIALHLRMRPTEYRPDEQHTQQARAGAWAGTFERPWMWRNKQRH